MVHRFRALTFINFVRLYDDPIDDAPADVKLDFEREVYLVGKIMLNAPGWGRIWRPCLIHRIGGMPAYFYDGAKGWHRVPAGLAQEV